MEVPRKKDESITYPVVWHLCNNGLQLPHVSITDGTLVRVQIIGEIPSMKKNVKVSSICTKYQHNKVVAILLCVFDIHTQVSFLTSR